MAVPVRRTSKTRKALRRSHMSLAKPNLVTCTNCGEVIKPHRVCSKSAITMDKKFYKFLIISTKTLGSFLN